MSNEEAVQFLKMNVTTEVLQLSEKLANQLSDVKTINSVIISVSFEILALLEELARAHVNITHILNTDHLILSANLRSSLGQFLEDTDSLKSLINSSALFHSVCQGPDHREEAKEGQNLPYSVSSLESSSSSDKQDDVKQHGHQD
ncbi:hypothetical protein NMD69_05110 [Edwardsiella tarda]